MLARFFPPRRMFGCVVAWSGRVVVFGMSEKMDSAKQTAKRVNQKLDNALEVQTASLSLAHKMAQCKESTRSYHCDVWILPMICRCSE